MSNVIGISGTDQGLIDILEEALTEARRGDLAGAALVTIRRGSLEIATHVHSPGGSRHLLVAGVTYLQGDLIREAREE